VTIPANTSQITTRYSGPTDTHGARINARFTTPRTIVHGLRLATPYDHAAKQGDHEYAARALAARHTLDVDTVTYEGSGTDSRGFFNVYRVSLERAQ
jgi:hypothetical protein